MSWTEIPSDDPQTYASFLVRAVWGGSEEAIVRVFVDQYEANGPGGPMPVDVGSEVLEVVVDALAATEQFSTVEGWRNYTSTPHASYVSTEEV